MTEEDDKNKSWREIASGAVRAATAAADGGLPRSVEVVSDSGGEGRGREVVCDDEVFAFGFQGRRPCNLSAKQPSVYSGPC